MIQEKLEQLRASRIKQWPVNANRASELGHPCLRYLVFNRTRWEEKTLHDTRLQGIFDLGNAFEAWILREIQEAGVQVIEQQRAFAWKEYNITGHIDAKVLVGGSAIPLEIKSSSPWVWESLRSVDDLTNGKYVYLRKYPAQLTLYMLMDNKEEGLFLFVNKQTFQVKELTMRLDYELGEKLLKKAEEINLYVETREVPEPIPYDEDICGRCGYFDICLPEIKRNSIQIEMDEEIVGDLEKWWALRDAKRQYDALDKKVKSVFKNQDGILVGDFMVTGKLCSRKVPATEEKVLEYWVPKIVKLTEERKGQEDE